MTAFRPPGCVGMNGAENMDRGDSSAAEREDSGLETLVSNPAPRSTSSAVGDWVGGRQEPAAKQPVTPGRIMTAPLPYGGAQWGLYTNRRECFGAIGSPGLDAETSEANAHRVVQGWNNYDAVLGLVLDLAADVRLPAELRERARTLVSRLGGLQ